MLEETGCDAIMIGRGVLGNPWLIKQCVEYLENGKLPEPVSSKEKIEMLKRHYKLLLESTSEKAAILEIRMHALWYIKGLPIVVQSKTKFVKLKLVWKYLLY